MEMNILQNIQIKLREKIVLSDFYIFLEEDKGLNQKEIKNLSKEELDKYFQEYVESERKMLDKSNCRL